MKFNFFQEVYSYTLNLNLDVLKDYHIDAQLMTHWNNGKTCINQKSYKYLVTFYLNNNKYLDKQILDILLSHNTLKLLPLSKIEELKNSLIFFLFEAEKELLNIFFNDEDHRHLIALATKIEIIASKKPSQIEVNRISINDRRIANLIQSLTIDELCKKFVRLARNTKYNYIDDLEQIILFKEDFKGINETRHLQVLGYWADLIQAYLNNEKFIPSIDNTKLNVKNKKEFPLTLGQSELIYTLFDITRLLTERKKESIAHYHYISNCIRHYNESNANLD